MSVLNVDKEHLEADADLLSGHVEAHHGVPLPVPDTLAPDQAALSILLLRQWSMMLVYKCQLSPIATPINSESGCLN